MKTMLYAAALAGVLAGVPTAASAGCAAPSVRVPTKAAMTTLLEGNTVCVPASNQPVMEAQEEHRAGGALWDYKRGPGHAVDPTTRIGTWTVGGTDGRGVFVRYDYTGGSSYTYAVWNNGNGTHSFCSTTTEVLVRIKAGPGPC